MEVVKVWIEVQLIEYRSIFENFLALGLNTLNHIHSQNPEFHAVYEQFTACQGKTVSITM